MSNHPQRADADLLDAAARSPEAFGDLYDRYAATAYGWARKAGLGEADALDLVAELFASAWVSRKRFRPPPDGSAGGWLHGIARNLIASHRRRGHVELRAQRRLGMRAVTDPDTWPALAERLDAAALRGDLEAALDQLPARHREAVQMRVVEELDYLELATRLDVTETTARKRVSVGLQLLRRRMEATR